MLDAIVSVSGALKAPVYLLGEKTGLVCPNYGWENIKLRYCKHFEIGIEVFDKFPLFASIDSIEQRAKQAVKLCRKYFSDFVIEPDILVMEGRVSSSSGPHSGYRMTFTEERDYSKPVMLDIIWDRHKGSCRILANIYDHFIDGIPALFLVTAIQHHLVRGKNSRLLSMSRKPVSDYHNTTRRFPRQPDRKGWARLLYRNREILWPVGAHMDVTTSCITALRDRIFADTGTRPSVSSIELGLLAIETGMDFTTDYVARGQMASTGFLDLNKGYHGLGMIRTRGYGGLENLSPDAQYRELCSKIKFASLQLPMEQQGKGKSSVFYSRYGRIWQLVVDFFEKRVSFKNVMSIAGTQCIGSNLNGVDTVFDFLTPEIKPNNIRYIFTASHGEFAPHIKKAREARGLPLYATELSLACSPLLADSEGKKTIYKSIKTSPEKAKEILQGWSVSTADLDDDALLKKLFNELYRPKSPLKGRIEKRAALLLEAGRTKPG